MTLALYVTILSLDAIRKQYHLSGVILAAVYVLTAVTYVLVLPGIHRWVHWVPRTLPIWLSLLALWCFTSGLTPGLPIGMAALGIFSYVFFVPLFYVGARLLASDRYTSKVLLIASSGGALIGAGGLTSSVLKSASPRLLQPITSSVAYHSFGYSSVYLAPSVFATAEQAAEELLIAVFAWTALTPRATTWPRRLGSAVLGTLIIGGLLAAHRRADIYVAVVGMIILIALYRLSRSRRPADSPMVTGKPFRGLAAAIGLLGAGFFVISSFLSIGNTTAFAADIGPIGPRTAVLLAIGTPVSFSGQGVGTSTAGGTLIGASTVGTAGQTTKYFINGHIYFTTEGGLDKTLIELGIVGVVLYAGVFWSALRLGIRSITTLDAVGRSLAVLTCAMGIIFLKGHEALDDPLVQPLFWLAAGGVWGRMNSRNASSRRDAAMPTPAFSTLKAGLSSWLRLNH